MIENGKKDLEEALTRHNNFLGKLKESVECPVCFDIPRSGTGKINFSIDKIMVKEKKDGWKVFPFSYRNTNVAICAGKTCSLYHFTS